MYRLMKDQENFTAWRKGLELADTIQKIVDALPSADFMGLRGIFRKMTFTIPCHIAEGLMLRDSGEGRNYFYRTLSCLEELLSNLLISEQMGYLRKSHTRKIKKEIIELNRIICELINPHRLLPN